MSTIWLIDTSVYLNVLHIPGYNQDCDAVLDAFAAGKDAGDRYLLPMATIWETGNHISRLPEGSARRIYAGRLVRDVSDALAGNAPYVATYFPDRETFARWLADFPDAAARNKSADKTREGVSLADLSLIKEWEQTCARNPQRRVCIWSLDRDLRAYDRAAPRGSARRQ